MRKVTLGGDRLGSGKKQKIELHGYERSTHNLGYLWRSSMSAGTLVPFLHEIGLPGDTFDINLGCDVKTHPTVGPLFGSYKVQLDIFTADIRLYQGQLHNNKLKIGLNMAQVKLPVMELTAEVIDPLTVEDIDNAQINPSCILSYLGIRGIGMVEAPQQRLFQACYLLAYWDIYKNYYANKQEEIGAVIHTPQVVVPEIVTSITKDTDTGTETLPEAPGVAAWVIYNGAEIEITYTGGTPPDLSTIIIRLQTGDLVPLNTIGTITADTGTVATVTIDLTSYGDHATAVNWAYLSDVNPAELPIEVSIFDLANLDEMREMIMAHTTSATPFHINAADLSPYNLMLEANQPAILRSQEGLGLKTYQSDLFNNWLKTEYIDGPGGINEITAVDVTGGFLVLDTLNLAKKVYNMLNRIAVSGGTYQDWIIATYDHEPYMVAETPVYHGGLIKELVFQEVVSNAENGDGAQPLGTLAGKGVMANKHKGGQVSIKVNEHCVILGIVSITPRIDYSQGNKWDVHLMTMDDFHKPPLDEIGFQELITEQMAWWSTKGDGTFWQQKSAGKQPAWINYMTNVNEVRGSFAQRDNEMFMILNRRYDYNKLAPTVHEILDLTTYIDPSKFNYIFADTALDSQNFWTQIGIDMTVRRKMSAKVMPQL